MNRNDQLSDLLLRWEQLEREGQHMTPQELCSDCPDLLPELEEQIRAIRSMDALLGVAIEEDVGAAEGETVDASSDAGKAMSTHSNYRVIRSHAKGGLGEVLVAEDELLGRQVALKVIRRPHDRDPQRRRRFVQEAEITSRLEHPGIVPVHGIGQDGDARLCYTMRLISGETLQDAVRQFHESPELAADDRARNLTLRHLLGRFVSVCNTIAYAHSQGVIHRDLKPANIMLGKFGETLVVDWGLAKEVGSEQWAVGSSSESEKLTGGDAVQLTQHGSAIGTPAFMSPEQSGGRLDELGPASDIYSLGATLYFILTGRAPIDGRHAGEVAAKVERGDFPRPCQLNNSIPRPLEAVCLKAMAIQPTERYSETLELANDLEHWLADEPVSAFREPMLDRAIRLARRHRTLLSAAAVLLVLAVVGLSISTVVIGHEKSITQNALEQSRLSEAETKRHERAAQEARQHAADRADAEAKAKTETEATLYLNRVTLAARELAALNVGAADELLDLCPAGLRGWEWYYLKRLHRDNFATLRGHAGAVQSVAFSPDGLRLASASSDTMVKVWNLATSEVKFSLAGHTGAVNGVAYSPDGEWIASVSIDKTVRIWDAGTGQPIHILEGHGAPVGGVAISPDSRTVASASMDGTVRTWDIKSGKPTATLTGHVGTVWGVAFHRDGRRLASSGQDETVRVWDLVTGGQLLSLSGQNRMYVRPAFSPDGRLLAAGSYDGVLQIWDADSGAELSTCLGHAGIINSVAFSPDSRRIASASWDKTVKVWDSRTGDEAITLRGHSDVVHGVSFSADGFRIASASWDQEIKTWDATPVVEGSSHGSRFLRGHTGVVTGLAFSSDGRLLATASGDQTSKIWDVERATELHTLRGHTNVVRAVCFSPDGRRVASGGLDRTVRLWEPATGRELTSITGHANYVWNLAFSPDGRSIASCGPEGELNLWDSESGQIAIAMPRRRQHLWSVAFSPDGTRLATCGAEPTIRILAADTGEETLSLQGHTQSVTCVTFRGDGERIASASGDGTVRVWDSNTASELLKLDGHTDRVLAVAFDPSGQRIASAGGDGTVKLWDANTGHELATLRGHTGYVWCVAFSPDGQLLASGGGHHGKGEAILWDVAGSFLTRADLPTSR